MSERDGFRAGVPCWVGTWQPDLDGAAAFGVMFAAPADESAQWGVNFWRADTEAAAATTTELGGTVIAEPFDTPVSRDAVLGDPQGAAFSVSQIRRAQGA